MTQAAGTTGALMNYPYERKASGGLAAIPKYDVGGAVRNKLEGMTPDNIKEYLKESDSPAIQKMAKAILREKTGMAGGGIIAFKQGDSIDEEIAQAYNAPRETPRDVAEQRAAAVTGSNRPGTVAPPNPRAITAVPAQAQAQGQAPAPVSPLMDFSKEQTLLDTQRAEATAKQAFADRPQSNFIAEAQEGRKALGLDQNEALATQRANVMAEKASLKDEAEYKRKMTLVKFFLAWGSTPGNTLIAGMKQFEKTIPEMVQNVDDEKKAKKETDKVIYELDNAVRLEKMGLYSEATAAKNKAAELANAVAEQVRKSQEALLKSQKDVSVAGAKIKSDENVAGIQAKSAANVAGMQAASRKLELGDARDARASEAKVREDGKKEAKDADLLKGYENQKADVIKQHEASKSNNKSPYYETNRIINRLEKQEELKPNQQKELEANKQKIIKLDQEFKERINPIQLKIDALGRKRFGSDYDAMTTSGSPAALPAGFVKDK